jgi:hypothetical protein
MRLGYGYGKMFHNQELIALYKEMCLVLRGNWLWSKRSSSWTPTSNFLPPSNCRHHHCSKVGHVPESEVRDISSTIQWCHWFLALRKEQKGICLCPHLPACCLQGVLLLKVCVCSKSDAFYHCYWAYTWCDKLQSMCALLEKQMYIYQ